MTSRLQGRERSDSRIAPGRRRDDTLQDDARVISNGAASAGMVRAPCRRSDAQRIDPAADACDTPLNVGHAASIGGASSVRVA
jgi:hypothetical protein